MASNNSKLQPVRGTQDAMPHENKLFRYIEETAFKVARRYGFGEISTPIFEFTELFLKQNRIIGMKIYFIYQS